MTELIVALDAREPYRLMRLLMDQGQRWFKLGPQAVASTDWHDMLVGGYGQKIFLDLKLWDTRDTIDATLRNLPGVVEAVSVVASLSPYPSAMGLKLWE